MRTGWMLGPNHPDYSAVVEYGPAPRSRKTITPTGEVLPGTGDDSKFCEAKNLVRSSGRTDPDPRTIRVISARVQDANLWRFESVSIGRGRSPMADADQRRHVARIAAATASRWGVPVGVVVGVREESAC